MTTSTMKYLYSGTGSKVVTLHLTYVFRTAASLGINERIFSREDRIALNHPQNAWLPFCDVILNKKYPKPNFTKTVYDFFPDIWRSHRHTSKDERSAASSGRARSQVRLVNAAKNSDCGENAFKKRKVMGGNSEVAKETISESIKGDRCVVEKTKIDITKTSNEKAREMGMHVDKRSRLMDFWKSEKCWSGAWGSLFQDRDASEDKIRGY